MPAARLTQETLPALLAAAVAAVASPAKGLRDRALIAALASGLRVCEARQLNVSDLIIGGDGAIQIAAGRKVWLTPETQTILRAWLAARALLQPPTPALFISLHWAGSPHAERLSLRGIRTIVDHHLRQIGAKQTGVSCHAIRRIKEQP